MVENFMQLFLEFKPQLFIDSQRRPKTGRGSQGGRWWRYSTNQPSDKKMRDSITKNTLAGNGANSASSEDVALECTGGKESFLSSDQMHGHGAKILDNSSPDGSSVTSLERRILPLLVLRSVHQSGVNCLHVSEVMDSDDKITRVYCVASGGDDQAVHFVYFQVVPMTFSASNCAPVSGSSFIEKCSYNHKSNGRHLKILQRQSVKSAHSSSVKGIWTNGFWVFSTGLDQRIRCWQIGLHSEVIERAYLIVSVPEPESLDVIMSDRKRYQIAVAGRGIQIIDFFPPNEG